MNPYNFYYKIGYDLITKGNFFAMLDFEGTKLTGIYPIYIKGESYKITTDKKEQFLEYLSEEDNEWYVIPMHIIIHLRYTHINHKYISPSPIKSVSESVNSLNSVYDSAVKSSENNVNLTGYIKTSNLRKSDDLKFILDSFKEVCFNPTNQGGIGVIDQGMEFIPLRSQVTEIPKEVLDLFKKNILEYFGINENVLGAKYTSEEWSMFFETSIEPIIVQLNQEFNYKLSKNIECRQVEFYPDLLNYVNPLTRLQLANDSFDRGVITVNEYRDLIHKERIDSARGGDERVRSLNYINTKIIDDYQQGKVGVKQNEQ